MLENHKTTHEERAYRSWRSIIEPQLLPFEESTSRLVSINPYSLMALGPDVSHWTPKNFNIEGSDFLIVKMGGSETTEPSKNPYIDSNFNYWAEVAWNTPNPMGGIGIPLIVYWMQNPRVYSEKNISKEDVLNFSDNDHPLLKVILQAWRSGNSWKQVKEWFFDIEEASTWGNVNDSWQVLYTDDLFKRFVKKMANQDLPRTKIGMYSRKSFLMQHKPVMDWLRVHPNVSSWPANYPRKIPNVSADEVRANYLPLANWIPYTLFDSNNQDVLSRDKLWDYWQFSGEPDWNVFNGTPQELYSRLGFTPREATPPIPEPIPVETPKFAKLVRPANIRKEASTVGNVPIVLLPSGTEIEITGTIKNSEGIWRTARIKGDFIIADEVGGIKYLDTPKSK